MLTTNLSTSRKSLNTWDFDLFQLIFVKSQIDNWYDKLWVFIAKNMMIMNNLIITKSYEKAKNKQVIQGKP